MIQSGHQYANPRIDCLSRTETISLSILAEMEAIGNVVSATIRFVLNMDNWWGSGAIVVSHIGNKGRYRIDGWMDGWVAR